MDTTSHIEFMLYNSKKCLLRRTKRAVVEQMCEETAILSSKQDKLKNMLTAEECLFQEEIIINREKIKAAASEMKRINALKTECAAEGRRRREAQEKIEELHRENSEYLRIQASIQKQIEAVAGMKHQIEEKHENDIREKELDAVWSEVMNQYYKVKLENEEAKEKERQSLKKLYKAVLQEQIAERDEIKIKELKEVDEEAEKIQEAAIEFEREEKGKLQKQISQKLEHAKNKYEDLIEFRAQREKQKLKEKQFENSYIANQLNGAEDEQTKINKKKLATRLELDLYQAQVSKIKEEIKKIEAVEEELRKRELSLNEKKHQEEAIRESIKRDKIEQEIMKMRLIQLHEKSEVPNDY